MSYDFYTDIKNLTGDQTLTNNMMDWALAEAKTFYIAANPSTYDDSISDIDNRLVAFLACGFIMTNKNNDIASLSDSLIIKFEEFEIEPTSKGFVHNFNTNPSSNFFKMFFDWKRYYLDRGVTLQFVDNGKALIVTTYDPTLYVVTRNPPVGYV